ncbi:hypothetical protein IAQ61_004956 [Plenodomus lingam]|uniref:Ubiquitin-like protease family profile domain-containing protein n=1 Tax=Leptosphaeria maculans (strain JN3 / isolate v23.1.3 / race Av1-4-5-6-7-8) TaxID=985895 RepID=E4ZT93_LEPMJ|nr:hypothetical protein LEMA_P119220.1 [Plenodomus lingam JN3]KAH9872556.1 hypothetical protein IAQ61_004956 [Plenodomus lingam]CBX90035.1 hypothetical protein LEMA_P119220.1 [Plenodomus lingam JN3]
MHATKKLPEELQALIRARLTENGIQNDTASTNIGRVAGHLESLRLSHWGLTPDKFMDIFGPAMIVNRRFVSALLKLSQTFPDLSWEHAFAKLSVYKSSELPWSERVINHAWDALALSSELAPETKSPLSHGGRKRNASFLAMSPSKRQATAIVRRSPRRRRADIHCQLLSHEELGHVATSIEDTTNEVNGYTDGSNAVQLGALDDALLSEAPNILDTGGREPQDVNHKCRQSATDFELSVDEDLPSADASFVSVEVGRIAPMPHDTECPNHDWDTPVVEVSTYALSDVLSDRTPIPIENPLLMPASSQAHPPAKLPTPGNSKDAQMFQLDVDHGSDLLDVQRMPQNLQMQQQGNSSVALSSHRRFDSDTMNMLQHLEQGRCLNHSTVMGLLHALLPQARCTLHDPGSIPAHLMQGKEDKVVKQLKRWSPRPLLRDPEDSPKTILVPLLVPSPSDNVVGHWILYAISPPQATIMVYDSLYKKHRLERKLLCAGQMIATAAGIDHARILLEHDQPQQKNNADCGIFTIMFALLLAVGKHPKDLPFDPLTCRMVFRMHLERHSQPDPDQSNNASLPDGRHVYSMKMWRDLYEACGEAGASPAEETDEERLKSLLRVQRQPKPNNGHLEQMKSLIELITKEADEAVLIRHQRHHEHAALRTKLEVFINTTLGAEGSMEWSTIYNDQLQQMRMSAKAALAKRDERELQRLLRRAKTIVLNIAHLRNDIVQAKELMSRLAGELGMTIMRLKSQIQQAAEQDEQQAVQLERQAIECKQKAADRRRLLDELGLTVQ